MEKKRKKDAPDHCLSLDAHWKIENKLYKDPLTYQTRKHFRVSSMLRLAYTSSQLKENILLSTINH